MSYVFHQIGYILSFPKLFLSPWPESFMVSKDMKTELPRLISIQQRMLGSIIGVLGPMISFIYSL